MPQPLDDLVTLLSLEALEENLFRGQSQDLGLPQLFGGQALGQAAAAATRTVPEDRLLHSLHGYFLRRGDAQKPVIYSVDRVRDGGSFTTRRVTAIQNGKPIFFCSASFQGHEHGLHHQPTAPPVATPEALLAEGKAVHRRFRGHPVEFITVEEHHGLPPSRMIWFRMHGDCPTAPSLHRYLLAYSSDFNLLLTALLPHDVEFGDPRLRIASLDHALWIHQDPRLDEWLLYVIESPWAGGARGFARGSFYDRDGRLIASTAQEGLMRMVPED
ncbi:acyl-CoA thioesterase domain-containing protein [Salinicola rhizosphaerae]|uniref:Acyl-CoA thioesterase II n=1 Tax=Salinicola rhizosphaerae TaxID=1443141 RepID=A0ABQ3DW33_9GAMM|nr:acyl-CoA thioesterase domain-containing protein [Salinicola rhizosphaerae]GHB18094.1 acyl-CoA thioesterase II [Salinicola rhizosphaerae]